MLYFITLEYLTDLAASHSPRSSSSSWTTSGPIRTILRNLEEKNYVSHEINGRTFLYSAVDSRRNVAVHAVQTIIDRFCGGSVEDLLVGFVDNQVLKPKQLQQLAGKIALRKEKQR